MKLSDYEEKNVRYILKSGEIFEGEAVAQPAEYCLHELGVDEAALEFGVDEILDTDTWTIYESEIDHAELVENGSSALRSLRFACHDSFRTTRWSGGTTTQFLIFPRDAEYAGRDFLWRVSSAVVADAESDFTALPDYDRYITPVKGAMTLYRDGKEPVRLGAYDILAFDGGEPVHSVGACTDFNLMLRKGKAAGRMDAVQLTKEFHPLPLQPGMRDLLLWCPEADCRVRTPWSEIRLPAGELLIGENIGGLPLSAAGSAPLLITQAREI